MDRTAARGAWPGLAPPRVTQPWAADDSSLSPSPILPCTTQYDGVFCPKSEKLFFMGKFRIFSLEHPV